MKHTKSLISGKGELSVLGADETTD